ncbi:MAG: FtsW/RodA/SpoVE family cell cycle protein, partial [Candidatus Hydrogenedentes bacterium]|nr:FtsW/RodA/SpoVE family cell cycle protein [Candidatus Hydrogenedentota bacterium]
MGLFDRQLVCVLAGLAAMFFLATYFDYHKFSAPFYFRCIVGAALILLVAVLIPGVGVEVNGATRWIRMPVIHQFQPSEVAKFALILLLARKLTDNRDQVTSFWRGFIPASAITGA